MNLFKKPILFLAFAVLVMPASGFAQYLFQVDPLFSYFTDFQRYELSATYVVPFATFAGVSRVNDGGGNYQGDSTAKRTQVGTGFGGSLGLSLPFKATGHTSCWAVNFHLMGHMYTWTDLNQTLGTDGTYHTATPSLSASTIQIALPIGIDWKAGNDAIKTKRLPFGTSLGVGMMPQMNITSVSGYEGSHYAFGCTPYAKVEGSVFVGLDIKVRAIYTMGDITLIDADHPIYGSTDGPFKITSNANFMLSLVVMIGSGGWEEYSWWTTHDTYNLFDRLN
jgi:hypothetical protein